jgi:hypothetical protein
VAKKKIIPSAHKPFSKNDYANLVKEMGRVINWDVFFPKLGKPKARKALTKYQKAKIKHAYQSLEEIGFNVNNPDRDKFAPIKHGGQRRIATKKMNQPAYLKGVFINEKFKPEKVYVDRGELKYKVSDAVGTFIPRAFIDVPVDDTELEAKLRVMLEHVPAGTVAVAFMNGASNFDLHSFYPDDPEWPDWFIGDAREWWNKYQDMYDSDELRTRYTKNGVAYTQHAAPPKDWFFGIMFQQKERSKMTERERRRMK